MARPKGNRKEARLSVSFEEREYAALRALAERHNVSVAWMVRQAVHDLIQHNRKPELPRLHRVSRAKQATP
jgi:hypothetical protein